MVICGEGNAGDRTIPYCVDGSRIMGCCGTAALPFGGYKKSGIGRDKSEYALQHYTEVKSVIHPLKDPAWL